MSTKTITQSWDVAELAAETRNAYSAGMFNDWGKVVALLHRRGYSRKQADHSKVVQELVSALRDSTTLLESFWVYSGIKTPPETIAANRAPP